MNVKTGAVSATRFELPPFVYITAMIGFGLYAGRDAFAGAVRYYFDMYGLGVLWFLPDIVSFACMAIFIAYFVPRVPLALFFFISFMFSLFISVLFMNDQLFGLFSSIKMFSPMFVGFCFAGRSAVESKIVRWLIAVIIMISVVGIYMSYLSQFPWVGQSIEQFGREKLVSRLWWSLEEVRVGGFAADSTMAGFMLIFLYFMLSPFLSSFVNLALSAPMIWILNITTSKTALGTYLLFLVIYILTMAYRGRQASTFALRLATRLSFAAISIPFLLILFLNDADLGSIHPHLRSLSDRIDNSWQLPFTFLADIFPMGLFTGCGIGCFSYPMNYTDKAMYEVPVDNFYMTTFLMMGIPFIFFVWNILKRVEVIRYYDKIVLLLMFNIYSVTVQCYGPAFATLLFGYAISDIFLPKKEKAPARRRAARIMPDPFRNASPAPS